MANVVDLYFTPTGNWRAMFAVVLIPALVLFVGMLKLPESPRWLLANGHMEKARQVMRRTHSASEAKVALVEIGDCLQQTTGDWSELFSKPMRLPLFIAIGVAIFNHSP